MCTGLTLFSSVLSDRTRWRWRIALPARRAAAAAYLPEAVGEATVGEALVVRSQFLAEEVDCCGSLNPAAMIH